MFCERLSATLNKSPTVFNSPMWSGSIWKTLSSYQLCFHTAPFLAGLPLRFSLTRGRLERPTTGSEWHRGAVLHRSSQSDRLSGRNPPSVHVSHMTTILVLPVGPPTLRPVSQADSLSDFWKIRTARSWRASTRPRRARRLSCPIC